MKAPPRLTFLAFALSLLLACSTAAATLAGGADLSAPAAPSVTPTAAAPAVLPAPPHGLAAVNDINTAQVGSLFDDHTYSNPNIAGLTFRTSWADIEPTEGTFVWDKLDTVFANAEKNGKWVALDLIPGFGTPSWALQGVQTQPFNVTLGPADTQPLPLPLPWDQTYLSRWFAFLQAVSARYQNRPSFVKIAADGPTALSSDMLLPNEDADLCTWIGLGYTSDQLIAAWQMVFSQYAQIFPGQYFSLALDPPLPIISTTQCPNGTLTGVDQSESQRVASAIIALGVNNYPKQFVLQYDALSGADENGADPTYYNFIRDYAGKVVTGFRLTTSAVQHPADMGAPGGANALRRTLQYGMDATPQFVEVTEADVLASVAQNVLATFASKLTASAS